MVAFICLNIILILMVAYGAWMISSIIKQKDPKNKTFPLYYCHCCKNCKYRDKNMKSLFNDWWLVKCADINGINIRVIIPRILYVIDWCKIKKCK